MKSKVVGSLAAIALAVSLSALGITLVSARSDAQSAFGGVPGVIAYQGYLTDANGGALRDGRHQATFRIYSSPTSTRPMWEEAHSFSTSRGSFSVMLGSENGLTPKVLSSSGAYLGVQVDKDAEMVPRQLLSSVPFAMMAGQATEAQSLNCRGCVTSTHLASDVAKSSTSTTSAISRIDSPNGKYSIRVTDNGIFLEGPNSNIMLDDDGVNIESVKQLVIKGSQNIKLEAQSDVDIKAGLEATINGPTKVVLDSNGTVDIDGSTVNIDGASTLNLDGALVKLDGGCKPIARLGDSVLAPAPAGVGTITFGSPTVFAC